MDICCSTDTVILYGMVIQIVSAEFDELPYVIC